MVTYEALRVPATRLKEYSKRLDRARGLSYRFGKSPNPYYIYMPYSPYLTHCVSCNATTSKSYAKAHASQCKACATGIVTVRPSKLCPDCGVNYLSDYQIQHHYHCDACTRDADPIGHYNEVMGYNDGPDY